MALLAVLIAWCVRLLRGYRRRSTQRVAAAPANLGRSALVPGIFGYLRRQTWRSQLWLVLGAVLSLPVLYGTLDMPQLISNNAIESGHFPLRFGDLFLSQTEFRFLLIVLFLIACLLKRGFKDWKRCV